MPVNTDCDWNEALSVLQYISSVADIRPIHSQGAGAIHSLMCEQARSLGAMTWKDESHSESNEEHTNLLNIMT
eukprot:3131445-Amphidinium_carterae.2